MTETVFVSDLHLDPDRPHVTAAWFSFLANAASRADTIYILGDLFEAWVGDDDDDPLAIACIDALGRASRQTTVALMHGNRDFLLAREFARRAGVHLLPDPTPISLYGRRAVLTHGDLLCTADRAYQTLRTHLRSAEWQLATLARPLPDRRALGAAMRAHSRARNANVAEHIMDVDGGAVSELLREHGADLLIHGHTHRPAIHRVGRAAGPEALRYVLGDWGPYGWLLRATPAALDLERFVIPAIGC